MVAIFISILLGCSNIDKSNSQAELGFSTLEISPTENITTSSTLVCEGTLSEGIVESEVTITYEWRIGSNTTEGNEITLDPTIMIPQSQVICTATIERLDETFSDSTSVQIGNTAPTLDNFRIQPEIAFVNSQFELFAEFKDDDLTQDAYLDLTIEWHVIELDGTDRVIDGEIDFTFANGNLNRFEKGESVYAVGILTDGMITLEPLQSNIVSILNTPPQTPTVAISADNDPAMVNLDALTCVAERPEDLDNDELTYTFTWLKPNGETAYIGTDTSNEHTLSGLDVQSEGIWTCMVEVSDGQESSLGESTYLVQNPDCTLSVDVLVDNQTYGVYDYVIMDLDTDVSFALILVGNGTSTGTTTSVDNYICEGSNGIIHNSTFDDSNEWWVGSLGIGSAEIANGTFNATSTLARMTLQNSLFTLTADQHYSFDMLFTPNTGGLSFILSNEESTAGCGMPYSTTSCPQDLSQEVMIGLFRDGLGTYQNEVCFSFESSLMAPGQWGVFNHCMNMPAEITDGWHNISFNSSYSLACGL